MSERTRPPALPDHRGKATWGDRVVPLETFAREVARHGAELAPAERGRRVKALREGPADETPVEGPFSRIVVFGGVYSNHLALQALLERSAGRRAEAVYCLGDLGGFGPHPEKVWPLLDRGGVRCIQGNYEQSLAAGATDCNCGYTDPRDNYFAKLSYEYTARNCSPAFKAWMGRLPARRRIRVGDRELLAVHGSPRRINEFLFRSTSPVAFLERLTDLERADGILCTHTGLHWHRRMPSGREVVNVGVIGRPANDGRTNVWFAWLEARDGDLGVELVELPYDHQTLAQEMRREALPEPFRETIRTGWWTTCLEILPARERAASRY